MPCACFPVHMCGADDASIERELVSWRVAGFLVRCSYLVRCVQPTRVLCDILLLSLCRIRHKLGLHEQRCWTIDAADHLWRPRALHLFDLVVCNDAVLPEKVSSRDTPHSRGTQIVFASLFTCCPLCLGTMICCAAVLYLTLCLVRLVRKRSGSCSAGQAQAQCPIYPVSWLIGVAACVDMTQKMLLR